MKLKYFLRGVGMGVIVSTLILIIAFNTSGKLTDEQIINRALELGLVYSGGSGEIEFATPNVTKESAEMASTKETLADSAPETSAIQESSAEAATEAKTEADLVETVTDSTTEAATVPTTTEVATEPTTIQETEAATTAEATTEVTQAPETTQAASESNNNFNYTLTIYGGMSSNRVATVLYENGIIANAEAFDDYLVGSGYADVIRIGTFFVNSAMSYEDIAIVITGR